ncbi:MAG: hypothetical protein PUC47_13125 [Oscillospiraceae bacterium]|nr:hypothetical protein [Oscillospiraceae bacterium]
MKSNDVRLIHGVIHVETEKEEKQIDGMVHAVFRCKGKSWNGNKGVTRMEKDPLLQQVRRLLETYIDDPETTQKPKKDIVLPEDVEMQMLSIQIGSISARDILDYHEAHPDASFWDFLKLKKPGLYGVTPEELLEDDD